jgi:putative two-component system response regulator
MTRAALQATLEETIRRLSRAMEIREAEAWGHIERIGETSALLARKVGLPEDRVELIRLASPMHDVGKIAIDDGILLKRGALTPEERTEMQRHAEIGHQILAGSGSELLELAATIAWTHHERWDGSGYPRGLNGEQIPIEGRIVAVADIFDALTHDRIYRPAITAPEALEVLREGRGRHFDPDVVDAFLRDLGAVIGIDRDVEASPARSFDLDDEGLR